MPPVRPALVVALALAALVVVGATRSGLAGAGHEEPAAVAWVDEGQPERLPRPTTTTTTTAPPPTTTTAPPPPPPPPPPAPAPKARAAAPAPAPAPPPPPPPAVTADPGGEARALQLINGDRSQAGLPPLQLNGGAASVARTWSDFMARNGMQHNPDLAGDLRRAGVSGWSTCGENVGYGASVDQVHSLFMGSGSHRANVLSGSFTQVGIGVVNAGGKVWVTVDFIG